MAISKGNAFISAAVAALGLTLTAGKGAVAETLLDEYTVGNMFIAQVNDAGNCIMIVEVNSGAAGATETRVVADNNGAVKLFSSFSAADALIRNARFSAGTEVLLKRKLKAVTVGDPIAELKSLHKKYVKESATLAAKDAAQDTSIATAVTLGWDTEVGTPKREAYDDMVLVNAALNEARTKVDAQKAFYATALTNAGIDPVTYLPV